MQKITVSKQDLYTENPTLTEQLLKQYALWAGSVPAGSFATLHEVMSFGHPNGYPPHKVPVDTWTDPFETGGIEGLELLDQQGPLCEQSFGLAKLVHKLA